MLVHVYNLMMTSHIFPHLQANWYKYQLHISEKLCRIAKQSPKGSSGIARFDVLIDELLKV